MNNIAEINFIKYGIKCEDTNKALRRIETRESVLFGMSGKMGSGKDTVGDLIGDKLARKGYDIVKISFSTPIKEEIDEIIDLYLKSNTEEEIANKYGVTIEQVITLLETLNFNSIYERTENSRRALQYWGTDVRRSVNPNYWVSKIANFIQKTINEGKSVYISDARFNNEVYVIQDFLGDIFRLSTIEETRLNRIFNRDGVKPNNEQLNHKTETALDDFEFETILDGSLKPSELSNIAMDKLFNKINKPSKGLFITLEGPDGSGKSTIAKLLKTYIENCGRKCILTREPGGTEIGEDIRNVLLDNKNTKMSSRTEALLYAASRAQHVEEKIKPYLDKGYVVISDRYVFSSLAYQGYSRGLGIEEVMEINNFAMNGVYPDSILFFDIEPEKALLRRFANSKADRLENAGLNFHKNTYKGYKQAINMYSDNVSVINAEKEVENTLSQCIGAIKNKL